MTATIRISEEQKERLDKEIEERFVEDVPYRVVIGEILEEV